MIVFEDAATKEFVDLVEVDASNMFTVGDMSKPLSTHVVSFFEYSLI